MVKFSSLIPDQAVSPKELAQAWNCTIHQIYSWINHGIKREGRQIFLEACRLGGTWVIDPATAEKFIMENNPGRTPETKPHRKTKTQQEAVNRASSWLAR